MKQSTESRKNAIRGFKGMYGQEVPFFIQEMIFTVSGAKGVQRFNGSHYKYFNHGLKSTIVASQLPVKNWHDVMMDPTLADAILDRLVHNAYKIDLHGESMREQRKA